LWCASFAGAKFSGGESEDEQKFLPPNPLPFCPPRPSGLVLAAPQARHYSGFRSKKVRASFSNCDQSKHLGLNTDSQVFLFL